MLPPLVLQDKLRRCLTAFAAVQREARHRLKTPIRRASTLKAGFMAIGALFAGLGYAFVFGSVNLPNLIYGSANTTGSSIISVSSAFTIGFSLFWSGVALFPVGLAVLAYGIAAKESPRETAPDQPAV